MIYIKKKDLTMPFDKATSPFLTTTSLSSLVSGAFIQGFSKKDLDIIDGTVNRFIRKYRVPGVSIAITKDGRLVYAKGFGVSTKRSLGILELFPLSRATQNVTIWDLFRIASVSKPITAVAIMKLIEQGKFKLADRVFGSGALLGDLLGVSSSPTEQNPKRITKIAVQHLLEHTSGGWANDARDPMFIQPEMNHNHLIKWVLRNRPLDHVPGSVYAYSNFGYCLLGRIIEKVTGQTYADYVKDNVLRPCGIENMHIAGDSLSDKRSDEVTYYAQPFTETYTVGGITVRVVNSDDPYSIPVARMDSHGGWLASAVDLVRFAVHVDGFTTKPDILNADSIKTMTKPTTANPSYAKGWFVYIDRDENNWFHDGSLPGTSSLLFRASNGFCWAALANTRLYNSNINRDLREDVMWHIITTVSSWPTHDLFPLYDDPWRIFVAP